MRRYFTRVKRNMFVAGVDVFYCKSLFCVFLMAQHSEIEAIQANFTRPRSQDRLRT
jgi:hypothetical protein